MKTLLIFILPTGVWEVMLQGAIGGGIIALGMLVYRYLKKRTTETVKRTTETDFYIRYNTKANKRWLILLFPYFYIGKSLISHAFLNKGYWYYDGVEKIWHPYSLADILLRPEDDNYLYFILAIPYLAILVMLNIKKEKQ